jgi:uncharacterized protein YecA (UPF0149 family)
MSGNDIGLSGTRLNEEIEMSEQDKTLMAEYGITSLPKTVYFYKEYRYDRLSDALSYAQTDTRRTGEAVEQETPVSPADL